MDLFALPVELRFKIYSELLVHCAPIDISNAQDFSTRVFGGAPPILYGEGIELWPALLRTSKRVYGEAISLLYSDNFFRFPDLVVTPGGYSTNAPASLDRSGLKRVSFATSASGFLQPCLGGPTSRMSGVRIFISKT